MALFFNNSLISYFFLFFHFSPLCKGRDDKIDRKVCPIYSFTALAITYKSSAGGRVGGLSLKHFSVEPTKKIRKNGKV
jgi:hypothetical protein